MVEMAGGKVDAASEKKSEKEEEKLVEERGKEVINFVKKKYEWLTYIGLAIVVWLSVYIRTRNLPILKDITTGGWTLGPDLDPFLFLRLAKEIVKNGSLAAIDAMRYSPNGFNTGREVLLHPYLIAWFHKLASAIGISGSVEQSAVLYPVFIFALTVIAFFFFVREIFLDSQGEAKSGIIALISSLFLSVLPVILPRTIAGIPEKEASGFFFMFLTFYLFVKAWKSKSLKGEIPFAILAGLSTAGMAFVWGGFTYIPLTVSFAAIIGLFIGQISKNKIYVFALWLFSFFLVTGLLSERYSISALLNSTTTLFPLVIFAVIIVDYAIFNTKLKKYFDGPKWAKIPKPIISLIVTAVLGAILITIIFGPRYIIDKIDDITHLLITPVADRIGITVAENRQPYFKEWTDSFGPYIGKIPIFFWLFFIGSVYLYNHMISVFQKKEKIYLTISYIIFLFAIVFSRYSGDSIFNGTNLASIGLYIIGVLALVGTFGYYYYQTFKRSEQEKLKEINFGLILLFSLFFLSVISARGAVRVVMMLVPPTSIIVAYFIVSLFSDAKGTKEDAKSRDEGRKLMLWIIFALVLAASIFSAYYFYQQSAGTAKNYGPYSYTQQWQKAMAWVRTNTNENAVFGHWWDYGYWLQSIGERATVLDGGNSIPYWDHLMGRYALTGTSSYEAAEFLYAHKTTHFLIDSTDIGKYGAFSSIGSDVNYDRASYVPSFLKDEKQTVEQKNSTVSLYTGGFSLERWNDVVYESNDSKIYLPGGKSGVGAVVIARDSSGVIGQPIAIFVYQNQQYRIPMRYAYDNGKFYDFGSGIGHGVFIYPELIQNDRESRIDRSGAMLYLSDKTVNSQLARLYLYKTNDDYFKLVHTEDDFLVASMKAQNALPAGMDFVYYQGFRGPMRIWEIKYPSGMQIKQEYLLLEYPDVNLTIAR